VSTLSVSEHIRARNELYNDHDQDILGDGRRRLTDAGWMDLGSGRECWEHEGGCRSNGR